VIRRSNWFGVGFVKTGWVRRTGWLIHLPGTFVSLATTASWNGICCNAAGIFTIAVRRRSSHFDGTGRHGQRSSSRRDHEMKWPHDGIATLSVLQALLDEFQKQDDLALVSGFADCAIDDCGLYK